MAITSRQVSSASELFWHDLSFSSAPNDGDLVVVVMVADGVPTMPAATDFDSSVGGTWTREVNINASSATALSVYWAVASSFTASFTIPAVSNSLATAACYPASGGTPALHATVGTNTSASATSLSTGTSTATGACTAVAAGAKDSAAGETGSWTSFTERADDVYDLTSANMLGMADSAVGGAGAVSDTWTTSGGADQIATCVVLFDNITLSGAQYATPSTIPYMKATLGSSAVAGNLLVIYSAKDIGGTNVGTPSGFTQIQESFSTTDCSVKASYKVAAGGETIIKATAPGDMFVWAREFQGWAGTPTLVASAEADSGGANVDSQTSGTAAATATSLAVCAWCKDASTGETVSSVTNSFTLGLEHNISAGVSGADAYLEVGSGSHSSTATWQASGASDQMAGLIGIFEDVGGGGGGITSFRSLLGVGF